MPNGLAVYTKRIKIDNPSVADGAIVFKTKPYEVKQSDGTKRLAIDWKKKLQRTDCTLRAHEHPYYNSDLFVLMLNRAYRAIIGHYASWCYLNELPEGVTVDTSKFMAVVTIKLPPNFR